jgi:hypothetical protein
MKVERKDAARWALVLVAAGVLSGCNGLYKEQEASRDPKTGEVTHAHTKSVL